MSLRRAQTQMDAVKQWRHPETVETMRPVFAQLLAQPLLIPLNLSRRVAEVWNKSINYAADLETQAHEENYDNSTHNHRKMS